MAPTMTLSRAAVVVYGVAPTELQRPVLTPEGMHALEPVLVSLRLRHHQTDPGPGAAGLPGLSTDAVGPSTAGAGREEGDRHPPETLRIAAATTSLRVSRSNGFPTMEKAPRARA